MSVAVSLVCALLWFQSPESRFESYLGLHIAVPAFEASDEPFDDPDLAPGLTVVSVVENSPASQAGCQVGDRLLGINGTVPRSQAQLDLFVADIPVGSGAAMRVRRGDRLMELSATTVPRLLPREPPRMTRGIERRRLGLVVSSLSAADTSREGLRPGEGAVVERILRGSPAEDTNLRVGDVILWLDRRKICGGEDLVAVAGGLPTGREVSALISRDGRRRSLRWTTLEPGSHLTQAGFPILFSYESDPRKEETLFKLLLGIFGYERKEKRSTYSLFWIPVYSTGSNEELEEVDP